VTDGIDKAGDLLASGDLPGLLRYLRADGGALPLGEVAALVAGAGRLAGFDDLAQAAALVADRGDSSGTADPLALYKFGYACMERGVGYLAVRPLARALELVPDAGLVLSDLVTALEQGGQHARALAVLEDHEPAMGWEHRFQYVYNALMAGDLGKAADGFGRLPEPEDTAWAPAREKVRRMLARSWRSAGRDPAPSPGPARVALRPDRRTPCQSVTVGVRRGHDRPLGLPHRLRAGLRGRAGAPPVNSSSPTT
jgi:hypothetical protein